MAVNEELLKISANAYKQKPKQDFSGLNKVDDSIHGYLDHKIDMKRDEEKRAADEDYQSFLDNKEKKENEATLEEVVKTDAENPEETDLSSLMTNSPLAYNAGLVAGAKQLYQGRRTSNAAMYNALTNVGKSIDGTVDDYIADKTLEKETLKEEQRLKKEKEQAENDRQEQVLNTFILKSGENNIDQMGSEVYTQVQDNLYNLKEEYLEIDKLDEGQEKQRRKNDIMMQMTSLDKELTAHSTEIGNYKTNIDGNLYSDGIDGNVKNLHNAMYTNATEVNYYGQDWGFQKKLIDGKMQMVLTDPNASAEISNIENSMRSLEEQKESFTNEEYNNAISTYQDELSQYKKTINPKEAFTSSTVFGKTDGSGMTQLFGQIDKIASNGQSESLQNIQGIIEQTVTDPKQLISYANDAIPGQGKSMRKHFEEMFPNGIPVEDEFGEVVEYRGVDQIFNPQNAYYRENDGQEILADLVKDYYSRIAINRFNANNNGDASIIGIQGSETLGTENYGETTFGLSEEEGNKFRSWVNDNHPDYASEINLDREFGSFTNSHITKAWKKLGEEYKKSTQFQEYDDLISKYYLK